MTGQLRTAAWMAALATLAGCATAPEGPPIREVTPAAGAGVVETGPGSCRPEAYAAFRGQSGDAVDRAAFDVPVRVIGPNDAVTQDYVADRVNFYTDGAGTIVRIACG